MSTEESRFGQQEDALNAEAGKTSRLSRLAAMSSDSWWVFLRKTALQTLAIFVVAAIVFALLDR